MNRLAPLLALLLLAAPSVAQDAAPDDVPIRSGPKAVPAQSSAAPLSDTVCATGTAEHELTVGGVYARLVNTSALVPYRDGAGYIVPRFGGQNAIYTGVLWLGGMVNGQLRASASTYGPYEMWPGPLDESGEVSSQTCAIYDRIWSVSEADVDAYEAGGAPTADLATWPVGVGAATVDADGDPVVPTSQGQIIDLEAGERPVVYGSEVSFWILNDVGGNNLEVAPHTWTDTPAPLYVEVRVHAFGISAPTEPALHTGTFYRVEVVNRNGSPIEDFQLGLYMDADLGDHSDDYNGTDPGRSLVYTFNDGPDDQYGDAPPAIGVDILSGAWSAQGYIDDNFDPFGLVEATNVLAGLCKDGQPLRVGEDGCPGTGEVTRWQYPASPPAFWSEFDIDGMGTQNFASDRRFVISAAPLDLAPGASATTDIGIVFGQGADALASIDVIKASSDDVQAAYDDGSLFDTRTDPPLPPMAAPQLLTPEDGEVFPANAGVEFTWQELRDATFYVLETDTDPAFGSPQTQTVTRARGTLDASGLPEGTSEVYWRVRAGNSGGVGPSSEPRSFIYTRFIAAPLFLSDGTFAEVEHVGPGGADPCGPTAVSTFGCDEVGGNSLRESLNGTGVVSSTFIGTAGSEGTIAAFGSTDYEIRFGGESYAAHIFYDGDILSTVPFEVWDIGETAPGAPNDPSDDVRMVPVLYSDAFVSGAAADPCGFDFDYDDMSGGGLLTPRIYAYYVGFEDYEAYAALAEGELAGADCGTAPAATGRIGLGRGRPIQRFLLRDETGGSLSVGDLGGMVVRFYTTDPPVVSTDGPADALATALGLAQPNPARARAEVGFSLAAAGPVRLRVLDVLGREVATVIEGERAAGPHTAAVPTAGLAPGRYLLVLDAAGERHTQAITVAR